jgi:transcriptional regulator with XRE-family HTH domain
MPASSRSTGDQADARKADAKGFGERVKAFRQERGLSLSGLAAKATLSKSYISAIEGGEAPRPSGQTLYAIAEALGVTMSDLLGRRLLIETPTQLPPSLVEFAGQHGLPEADVRMLASINFRGDQPQTPQRWAHIYSAIRQTEWMDREVDPSEHGRPS